MIGKSDNQNQRNFFQPLLKDFIHLGHELVLLSDKIDWNYFEKEFSIYYSHTGKPAMPLSALWSISTMKKPIPATSG